MGCANGKIPSSPLKEKGSRQVRGILKTFSIPSSHSPEKFRFNKFAKSIVVLKEIIDNPFDDEIEDEEAKDRKIFTEIMKKTLD